MNYFFVLFFFRHSFRSKAMVLKKKTDRSALIKVKSLTGVKVTPQGDSSKGDSSNREVETSGSFVHRGWNGVRAGLTDGALTTVMRAALSCREDKPEPKGKNQFFTPTLKLFLMITAKQESNCFVICLSDIKSYKTYMGLLYKIIIK